jgi:hypothetical protein
MRWPKSYISILGARPMFTPGRPRTPFHLVASSPRVLRLVALLARLHSGLFPFTRLVVVPRVTLAPTLCLSDSLTLEYKYLPPPTTLARTTDNSPRHSHQRQLQNASFNHFHPVGSRRCCPGYSNSSDCQQHHLQYRDRTQECRLLRELGTSILLPIPFQY